MAGVTGDFGKLRGFIDGLRRLGRPSTRQKLKQELGKTALTLVHTCFLTSTSPYGRKWKPVRRGGTPLMLTLRLFSSLTMRTTSGGFVIRSPLKYASTHNRGATIRAKHAPYLVFKVGDRWAKKKEVVIPRRQFLPEGRMPSQWKTWFERVTKRVTREAMGRR